MRHQAIKFLVLLGTIFLVFFSSLLLLAAATFFLNEPIGWYDLPAAAIVAVIFAWFAAAKYFPRQYDLLAVSLFCFVAIFIFSVRLSGSFYDLSWDGQTYQSEAIMTLARGWNPVWQPLDSTTDHKTWISFYPKGPWITSAALVKFLGTLNSVNAVDPYRALAASIEQGKAMNLLLTAASACFALAALLTFRKLKWHTAAILGLLLVLNPVTVSQEFSYYVDGQLASCLLILISLMMLLYRRQDWVLYTAFIAITMMTINAKLTGGVYIAVLGGGFALWYFLTRKQMRKTLIACLAAGCFLGAIFVGYNPYITQYARNFVEQHDPFYPTTLTDLTLIDRVIPQNFASMSPWKRLIVSLLAQTSEDTQPAQLKLPFTASSEEFNYFTSAEVRVAGLGPLFGSACIVALLVAILLAITTIRQKTRIRLVTVMVPMLFLMMISVLINPEAWWFRYVPQLWLIPILIAVLALSTSPRGHLYGLAYLVVTMLLFNALIIGYINFDYANRQRFAVADQMATLRQQSNAPGPLYVAINGWLGTRYRLIANKVNFLEVKQLPCQYKDQQSFDFSHARYCVAAANANPASK